MFQFGSIHLSCVYKTESKVRFFVFTFFFFCFLLYSVCKCVLVRYMFQNYILETHLTVLAIREPKPRSDSALVPRPEVLLTDSFFLRCLVCEVYILSAYEQISEELTCLSHHYGGVGSREIPGDDFEVRTVPIKFSELFRYSLFPFKKKRNKKSKEIGFCCLIA